jgi:hypothetical protein
LAVTIGYCARLSKRIRQLQDSRSELGEMIMRFDQATGRAMTSLAELQTVSKKITDALQIKIEKANFLADDLVFLIEKATKLANPKDTKTVVPEPSKTFASAPKPSFDSQFAKPRTAPTLPPAQATATSPNLSSIEAVLQRLSAPGGMGSVSTSMKTPTPPAMSSQQARTGAERELLEALKSGR